MFFFQRLLSTKCSRQLIGLCVVRKDFTLLLKASLLPGSCSQPQVDKFLLWILAHCWRSVSPRGDHLLSCMTSKSVCRLQKKNRRRRRKKQVTTVKGLFNPDSVFLLPLLYSLGEKKERKKLNRKGLGYATFISIVSLPAIFSFLNLSLSYVNFVSSSS